MNLHQLIPVLVLTLAGRFLAYADDSQKITATSAVLEKEFCYFPVPDVFDGTERKTKTEGCNNCKEAISLGIIQPDCCVCCLFDDNPRNESVFLGNSLENKPKFEVLHSCKERPQLIMMSENVTLEGETRFKRFGNSCTTTYMLKEPLDKKFNGSVIKCQILTDACKYSEEFTFIYNPTELNGISVGSAVGIAGGVLGGIVVLFIVWFILYKRRRSRTPIVTNGHPGLDAQLGMNPNGRGTTELHNLNKAAGLNGHLLDRSESEITANRNGAIEQRKDNVEEGSQLLNGRGGVPTDESSA